MGEEMAMSEKQTVLSVTRLKKKIKNNLIIKGIDFEVYGGEVFGFLGPNGSGKTTTIRMLVGLIRPTEGSIVVSGVSLLDRPNEALQNIGCIVENPELYPYLSGWENLEHFARMMVGVTEERIHEVVSIVGMDNRIHDKVRTYSLGMRQRLGIAQALLGKPKLLILDEPTNGLDPQGIKEMREFIRNLAADGLSVFVSSHLLSEIQLMCDRVAIISNGTVLAVGEVNELLKETQHQVVWQAAPFNQTVDLLTNFSDVKVINKTIDLGNMHEQTNIGRIITEVDADRVPDITATLVAAGIRLYAVEAKYPTLEELFLKLTEGGEIR